MQKKQLVTDILIEEYQKELAIAENEYKLAKYSIDYCKKRQGEEKVENILTFISRLQSLHQQEVQNVIDAAYDTSIRYAEEKGFEDYLKSKANDYFTQTFEQKGGGNG